MKKTLKTVLCAALALAIAAIVPMTTVADNRFASSIAQEKLEAFWQLEAYDGLNNGEATCDTAYLENIFPGIWRPSYHGGWETPLLGLTLINYTNGFYFNLMYEIWYGVEEGDEAADIAVPVAPDLYGDLDLAETNVIGFGNPGDYYAGHFHGIGYPEAGQTHITSVMLDDCWQLGYIGFSGQEHCTELSAVNCPALRIVQLVDGAFEKIAFSRMGGETLSLHAFGAGTVGAQYYQNDGSVIAYPENGTFVGWFEDGELVSTALGYARTEGGSLTAVFGGDADGDGAVTVADAVLTMRASMGVTESDIAAMVDVNGSGDADVADALLIMRFAMGLI